MLRTLTASRWGLAAVVAAGTFAATVFALRLAPTAEAQTVKPATVQPPQVAYSSYMIQTFKPSTTDAIQEVLAFPESSCFLVRTGSNVVVWERRNNAMVQLLEVKLNESVKNITFLDDHRTFLIQTKNSLGVYSIDKRILPATSQ